MKKKSKLFRAMKLAESARLNLDEVMEEDSLSDKEFNAIREAHDSIASARDAINRLINQKGI